jgi:hypothetical protein
VRPTDAGSLRVHSRQAHPHRLRQPVEFASDRARGRSSTRRLWAPAASRRARFNQAVAPRGSSPLGLWLHHRLRYGSRANSPAPLSNSVTHMTDSASAYSKPCGRKKPCCRWTAKITTSICTASNNAAHRVNSPSNSAKPPKNSTSPAIHAQKIPGAIPACSKNCAVHQEDHAGHQRAPAPNDRNFKRRARWSLPLSMRFW